MSGDSPRIPPAYRILPGNIYYGWYVTIACAVLMFVGVGVGYYGLAVYLSPLQDEHGWSNTAVSGATGIYFSLSGLAGAAIGPYIDRKGPLPFMVAGVICTGVAASAIGYVESLWQLYAVYSVLAIGFGMAGGVAVNSIMTRWYVQRRAKAMSISATGVSAGGVVLSPLIAKLIDIGGIELASPLMGLLVLTVALPVIFLVLAWDPSQLGLKPDGNTVPAPSTRSTLSDEVQLRRWPRSAAMRTVSFWAILVAFLLVLMAQTGFVIHQISFLEDRMGSRSEAAFALSLTAFGSIVARLIVGMFADAIDKRLLTFGLFVVQATSVLLVVYIDSIATTWLFTFIFGFTIGNVYMMQALIVGEIFGVVSFGSIFGLITLAGQVGSGGGPFAVGILEDATGGYTIPFTITAAVTYFSALVVLFASPIPAKNMPLSPRPTPFPPRAAASQAAVSDDRTIAADTMVARKLHECGGPLDAYGLNCSAHLRTNQRTTVDIDVVVDMDTVDADALVEAFQPEFFLDRQMVGESALTGTLFNALPLTLGPKDRPDSA
ncbi:MAG: MFS transporter [Dehalococcoidia bacterium]|nr:MFS transporter [Dehalococcoidia bacterium]